MRKRKSIDKMYAFLAIDPADKTEGLVAEQVGDIWYPMVGADMERVDYLRPVAERIAREHNQEVVLVVFDRRTELERFLP